MNHLTVGVLGHVDHGKTTLVKTLTGVDTDRLKEEKERGISIVLGFADLTLPSGHIAFVDVPGHERFVRTMVSGATGIGVVLLAVAANEGVMPQTVEHLDIAGLLGIRRGIVALTQCDRVAPEERDAAIQETREYLSRTFLSNAPIITTSSVTGEGLDALRAALDALVASTTAAEDEAHAYLPIDRVFSMTGAGTIVTGTLRRGSIAEGDEVEVYPHGERSSVRQVQVHGIAVPRARPGERVALNLRHVTKASLSRGDALAHPGTLQRARFLDADLRLLPDAEGPLYHGQRLRVLFGTSEVFGRLHLIDRDELAPGDRTLCQLHLESSAAFLARERFIVRTYSPMRTVGGGRLLGATISRRRREDGAAPMEVLARGNLEEILTMRCREAQPALLELRRFAIQDRFSLDKTLAAASDHAYVRVGEDAVALCEHVESVRRGIIEAVKIAQHEDTMSTGLSIEELHARLGDISNTSILSHVLGEMLRGGVLAESRGRYRLSGRSSGGLSERDRDLCVAIESIFAAAGLEPPGITEVVGLDKDRSRAYRHLVDTGVLLVTHAANKPRTLANTLVFHRDSIARAQSELLARFGTAESFETSQVKSALNLSRKFLIPLLELLDARGFTRRRGDARIFLRP